MFRWFVGPVMPSSFKPFIKNTPSPIQLNRKQCLQTLGISHQEADKSKEVHVGAELNLTATLLSASKQYDQREAVKCPPFVKSSLIVSKNPSQKKLWELMETNDMACHCRRHCVLCLVPLLLGQFVAGGSGILCELAEESHIGKGHTCFTVPAQPGMQRRKKPTWPMSSRTSWKSGLLLRDDLQEWTPTKSLKCLCVIRKMLWTMVCKSQASLQNVRRHFKVAELSWHLCLLWVIYT